MNLLPQLKAILHDISFIPAELAMVIGLLMFLVLGLLIEKKQAKLLPVLAMAILFVTGFFLIQHLQIANQEAKQTLYGGMITQTKIASFFKLIFIFIGILTIIFTEFSYRIADKIEGNLEYYFLLLGGILGLNLMVISTNLLMLFLAIETVSLTSYALVLFKNDTRSKESATKYLLYGLFITAFMLYGMSLLYACTGSLNYVEILKIQEAPLLFIVGMFFMLMGAFFKLSLAPFHTWAPDVYEGSPMPIVAYLSVGPKLGGLIALGVFLASYIEIPLFYNWTWREILAVLSILTMTIGNFSALLQSNVKRMLAYSSIAHAGFLLIGIVSFTTLGIDSLLFYAIIYLFMNFSIFMLVDVLIKKTNSEEIKDFAGIESCRKGP